jgi:hypothetical protein
MRSKLVENMATSIGDAGWGRRDPQIRISGEDSRMPRQVPGIVEVDCAGTRMGKLDKFGRLGSRIPLT